MSFFEKIGLGSKKRPAAPVIGEKKKEKEQTSTYRNNLSIRILIICGFMGILYLSIPKLSYNEKPSYDVGQPWRGQDLTAPFTFAIQKSDKQLAKDRQQVRDQTPPIFYRNKNVPVQIQTRLDSIFTSIQPALQTYKKWKKRSDPRSTPAINDSVKFMQQRKAADVPLTDGAWRALLQNYQSTVIADKPAHTKTAPSSVFIGNDLKQSLQQIINTILQEGVVNRPKKNLDYEKITLRNQQKSTEQTLTKAGVRDLEEAREYAQYRLSKLYYNDISGAAAEIFNHVVQPNLIYNASETQAKIQEGTANIATTNGAIAKGQVIIRKGDIINQEKYNALQSLNSARTQNASISERWLHYAGDVLAVTAIVVIFFFYLYLYRRHIFTDNAMLLMVLLNMSLVCIASSLLYQFSSVSIYIIPIAVAPIILTIIFDSRVGLVSAITLALLIGLINGNNFEFATATIIGCCLGLFSVRDIKKRSQFFVTTPGIVFVSYAVVIISFSLNSLQGWAPLGHRLLSVGINAILLLGIYPLILFFERSFNVTTDLTLLELADTNLPLLKRLMNKAPGTFHHSLQVANLAEAAAGAIRANGLLCRVGALYHDIGKMENPGYFTENQTSFNEHDKLKPSMSALVIKAHVSNGVNMAEENNLPELVIDFIRTHHGTSVIRYFYEKARENADENKDEVHKEDFRYDGPVPNTKETGILMLADGVEAASRAMKDPNYQKLDNLIDKMIEVRINEGQLSKTPLTFRDLSTIKDTFLNILIGIYHSRVEYPDDEDEGKSDENTGQHRKKGPKKKQKKEKKVPLKKKWAEPPERPVNDYYNS